MKSGTNATLSLSVCTCLFVYYSHSSGLKDDLRKQGQRHQEDQLEGWVLGAEHVAFKN